MQPFNILYLNSHDTGRAIQPLGFPVATPHLQRLAEQGILFRNNFCVAPTCSPSRASLLTGSYPHQNGMLGLAHRGFRLNDYKQHLIHTLHTRGYASVLAGGQHVAQRDLPVPAFETIGYQRELAGDNAGTDQRVVDFLESRPTQPFYLEAGIYETHRVFPGVDKLSDDPRYCQAPAPLPDTAETRLDIARFKTSARILDRKVGRILETLERTGLLDRTLVICTTDHGIAFPRHKCHLQDSGIGTFLILRAPKDWSADGAAWAGGRVIDAMTSHLDLFPTLCELLEIPPPSWLQGRSLLPLLRGETAQLHDEIFGEVNFHAAVEPQRSVRTNRWKYIRRFGDRTKPVLPNCDDGESKTAWLAAGYGERPVPVEQLYDLAFDPVETNNLALVAGAGAGAAGAGAANSAAASALAEMRGRLTRWMKATHDPLLNGPLIPPRGVVLNDPDGRSPSETPLPPVA